MKKFAHKSPIIFLLTPVFLLQTLSLSAIAQEENKSLYVTDSEFAQADTGTLKKLETINLVIGDVQVIETKALSRIAVTNPEIVDISDAKADKIFVVGKKAGQTEMFIWDDGGKRSVAIRVASENLDNLIARIKEILDRAQVKGVTVEKNEYEGKVMLSGSILKTEKDSLDKILEPYNSQIINLVKNEVNEDLIEIDAQVLEIDASLEKTLGFNWVTGSQTQDATTGQITTTATDQFQPNFLEVLPRSNGKPGDFFKIGNFYRGKESALVSQINALVNDNKGRIISRPRLVVMNGKEANFLVGGEIPITSTVTSSSSSTTQTNVTYKQYGVNMTITPTIREGKIDILLNVHISDIDQSTKNAAGDVGFITRSAQSQLFLEDRQTIVLAGFIKHTDSDNVRKIAFLGDIPLLGAMFRTRSTPVKDTEMVIILTPRILKAKKMQTEQIVMPSKRIEDLGNEIAKGFDKESLVAAKKVAPEKPAPMEVKEIKTPPVVTPKEIAIPTPPAAEAQESVVASYVRSIQLRISKAISYPPEAVEKKWEGSVKLRLRILKDGTLVDSDVMESSGHDAIDKDALNTAKTVAPYSAFPQNMQQGDIVVTIPIVYNQTASKNTQATVASY